MSRRVGRRSSGFRRDILFFTALNAVGKKNPPEKGFEMTMAIGVELLG